LIALTKVLGNGETNVIAANHEDVPCRFVRVIARILANRVHEMDSDIGLREQINSDRE
jgi:hypothetical protein